MTKRLSLEAIVTIALALLGASIMVNGLRLKVGYLYAPEPGFFPFVAGAAIVTLSVAHLLTAERNAGEMPGSVNWTKALALAAALFIYTLVLDFLGFVIATSLLAIALMRIAHPQPWWRTIAISVPAATFTYGVFCLLLHVDLPSGSIVELIRG